MPIARIRGSVEDVGGDWIIIGVGGIGVLVSTPATVAESVVAGQSASLFTHLHVREDALTLYGFLTREDLVLFEQLISVSGVGPRVALGLLSAMDAPQLAAAIIGGRSDALRKVPGVGQKTAERIVLDLRDKVTPPELTGEPADSALTLGEADEDVIIALMALGYSQQEASSAAASAGGETLEEKVRSALQAFSRT
jgi:Holliday junction DNA helicase RuvA